ncbi:MAG: DUF177 domain-containing protein [Muribaculaceae bacterium]|nr:DUF177 domain-containing protein [Muribaculaceae bacterium]
MGKFTEYKLMLKSLPMGKHTFEYHLDKAFFQNMENGDVRDADANVTLEVDHRSEGYNLHFHLTGTLTLLCDRCLDELPIEVDTEYALTVKYGDDYNDDSDTLLVIPESDNYLNVAYMIYDTAVLAIPARHVHPLGKCNRAMSALNKKYARSADDEDAELEDELLDGIDDMPAESED